MCARYLLTTDAATLASLFKAAITARLQPRYNIAPSQPVPVVVQPKFGSRIVTLMRWGLVPSWAKDISIGHRLIMARSETAAEKPAFQHAMKYRRCLLPTDGFYEWQSVGEPTLGPRGGRKSPPKQPHFIQLADESTFAIAGLYEHWMDEHGNELETCTLLTTTANEMMAEIHDRMPVILAPEDYDAWLDPNADTPDDVARVQRLLRPYPAELMMSRPVSRHVNDPKHDNPRCIEPIEQQGRLL